MDIVAIIAAAATLWIAQALGVSRLMSSRGFHPLPWLAVSLLTGPAMWPLAVVDLISGPPGPVRLRKGAAGDSPVALIAFERDELDQQTALALRGLRARYDRLVLARVIKAEGPAFISSDAHRFLCEAASRIGAPDAELQLHHGVYDRVVRELRERGDFDLVVRSDHPSEPFEGDDSRQEMRCHSDVTAA